ncbi:hypothetical protein [Methylobacterium sp. 1973]|uniref:hypothetical protein n=1 Tax=Methylobacterium sp. 1973 TaxID=3156421 RepID=UPI003398133D
MSQRNHPWEKPKALCLQELPHGGFIVTDFPQAHYEMRLLAAFTRLSDAVSWMEEAMRTPPGTSTPPQLRS